ncbi:MAG TPA: VOC family protein [Vicinamibacterales bacterium]|nr:VOC family protein [Vicinamibacterales bacterium]
MADPIDSRVDIGHVHLKVADLERALAFYAGVLGFEVTERMGAHAAFLSAGGYHHHIGLNTWESRGGSAPPQGSTGLYHFAIRYPDRRTLGDALRRLQAGGIPLEGAADHGVSEALYVRDPDGNGLELYRDRPPHEWPRSPDGSLAMTSARLDLNALLADAAAPVPPAVPRASAAPGPALPANLRRELEQLRGPLLNLHQALLDDARKAYEMDRGTIASKGALLQMVIHDPWFAWLHRISELVVRIDEATAPDSVTTAAEARGLVDQVDHLIVPSENGDEFGRRYFDALQRQPAVVLAHGEVKRVLKAGFGP